MQLSNLPARILAAFAVSGSKRTIPVASQIGVTPGAASYTDGFPPLTFTPLASGGIPPAGQDFNGIFNAITLIQQWQSAGGSFAYDAAWSTANNGYPKGACIARADGTGFWFNTVDNNTADPDGVTPTGWVPEWQYGITAVTGLTNANVTLTSLQYGRPVITLAGTLTGNVQIILPAISGQQWLIANNTTGAFSLTVKTAAGTGQTIPSGQSLPVWGDGTNINSAAPVGRLINVQRFISSGTYTPTPGTQMVVVTVVGGGGAGGGGFATSAGTYAVGSGGGSGALVKALFTTGFSGAAVVVGAGGAGISGAQGGNGNASSFAGAAMSAPGGGGGNTATAPTSSSSVSGQGAQASVGIITAGVPILVCAGQPGLVGYTLAGFGVISGQGGPSPLGGGGGANTSSGVGNSALTPGAGGAGSANNVSQPNIVGGAGASGLVIVEEFA